MSKIIKIHHNKEHDLIEVYSDFSQKDKLKSIPGGVWSKVRRCWRYPLDSIIEITDLYDVRDIEISSDAQNIYQQQVVKYKMLDRILSGKARIPEHDFLMEHQRKCREITKYFDRFALFLDTGKTLPLILVMV